MTGTGNTLIVVSGGSNNPNTTGASANTYVSYSTNGGTSWTANASAFGGVQNMNVPFFDGTYFIIPTTGSGAIYYNTPTGLGSAFTSSASTAGTVYCGAYGNGIYVYGGTSQIWWTTSYTGSSSNNVTISGAGNIYSITYALGYFWATGTSTNAIYYSVDAKSWTQVLPTQASSPMFVAYGNGTVLMQNIGTSGNAAFNVSI
jgi:hypothetical protein